MASGWKSGVQSFRPERRYGIHARDAYELVLYLLSHPESLHCRNLAVNASMAAAIYVSAQGWADPGRGLQLFGACAQAADIETAEAERVYSRRFSQYSRWKATLDPAGYQANTDSTDSHPPD